MWTAFIWFRPGIGGREISVSIKCRETDEVSKHQLFGKLNHTQNWNILCTFIIALFTARSNKISKKATF